METPGPRKRSSPERIYMRSWRDTCYKLNFHLMCIFEDEFFIYSWIYKKEVFYQEFPSKFPTLTTNMYVVQPVPQKCNVLVCLYLYFKCLPILMSTLLIMKYSIEFLKLHYVLSYLWIYLKHPSIPNILHNLKQPLLF